MWSFMAIIMTLDEFVEKLQLSVARAQANIEKGNRGRLERMIDLDPEGRSDTVTCSFVIDDPADGSPQSTVQLPLFTLRPYLAARVTELRVELNTTVEEPAPSRKTTSHTPLRLMIGRRAAAVGKQIHTLGVTLMGEQPGRAEITVDGLTLKSLGS
jgi:hypothetical protein